MIEPSEMPPIDEITNRLIESDRRNLAQRIESALKAHAPIRLDDEGTALISKIIHAETSAYKELVANAPDLWLDFLRAAGERFKKGAFQPIRILLRFEMPTGKGQSCTEKQ